MDSNPLLLQLKQLFIYYLYGVAANLQTANLLAHFPTFPEDDLQALEMLISDKMRTYLLNSSARLDEYVAQDGIPAALDKLHKWHLRCQFVNTYLRDHPHFAQDLGVIKEILFQGSPSMPQIQTVLEDYEEQVKGEIEVLEQQNEALEALRVDTNEQIYEQMKDLFP